MGAGQQGRRVGDGARRVDRRTPQPAGDRHGHEGVRPDRRRTERRRPLAPAHHARRRGLAEAAADRLHRPLPGAHEYERELEPLCLEQNVGVIPYPRSAAAFCPASPPSTARAAGVQKAYMTERGFAAWSYSSTPRRARRSTKRARGERHDGSLASATVTHVTTATAPDHSARVRLDAAFPSAVADARSGGDDRRQRGARPGRETRRFRSRRPGRPEAAGPACLARTRNADRSLDSVRSIRTAPPSILAHHLRGESTFATAYTSDT